MDFTTELALLAGASYKSNKSDTNLSPLPPGWVRGAATYQRDGLTGFEADTYINFDKKQIVIGFAGTNFEFEKSVDFGEANVPLGAGLPSPKRINRLSTIVKPWSHSGLCLTWATQ